MSQELVPLADLDTQQANVTMETGYTNAELRKNKRCKDFLK
jgi:hypothetical protein